MDHQLPHRLPSKTKLMFRLVLIFVISCGLAEIIEVVMVPLLATDKVLLFEIFEYVTLISLLLIFMTRFVTNPLLQEMSLRMASEEQVRQNELTNLNIIESFPDSVLRVAADGTIIDFRLAHNNFVSFEIGGNVSDSLPPESIVSFLHNMNAALKEGRPQQVDLCFKRDTEVSYQVFNFVKSTANEVFVFIRDITRRKIYEERLEHLSSHDALTGLYNRTFYEAEIDRIAISRRYPVSIIIIDLDGLKITNDTYGHAAGDKMICKAADILKKSFRAEDMVARTGGDEFTVLLPETGRDGLQEAIVRILHCLEEANIMNDGFEVKLSMGTAIADTKEKLLGAVKMADMRMYEDKAAKKIAMQQDQTSIFAPINYNCEALR